MKKTLFLIISLLITLYAQSNSIDTTNVTPQKSNFDGKHLLICTGMHAGVMLADFTFLWYEPESYSCWDKTTIKENGWGQSWVDNVTTPPVWDDDNFFTNFISHPYAGSLYYTSARTSGCTVLESFAYSAFLSTVFWEYGMEAFIEVPSIQDLVATPTIGSAMGEGFYVAKKAILRNDGKLLKSKLLGGITMCVMDPFNQILDWCGYKNKAYNIQSAFAPTGYDPKSGNMSWGIKVNISPTFH